MKKKETIFIVAILAAAAVFWAVLHFTGTGKGASVLITVDGEDFGTYSLGRDQTIEINETNVCEIRDGMIRMTDATCPDKLCIHQGAIDEKGGMIVCLPNKVVIQGVKEDSSGSDSGVDAVS